MTRSRTAQAPMGYRDLIAMALPFILANAAVPTLGLVDTAVIGHTGHTADLGAIALGALLFDFIFWSFGFLRMGTTGFVAQADGQGDEAEVRAAAGRSLVMAGVISGLLLLLTQPIEGVAFALFGAGEDVERIAAEYFRVRMWGAPASLSIFALLGVLIGLGQARKVLVVQVFLNGLNILLDLLFAGYLEMGVRGIAMGTVIAEWITLAVAGWLVLSLLRGRHQDDEAAIPWERIRQMSRMWSSLRSNLNIMIRTLFLVFGFAWFTDHGARFGDTILAANHVLLQFIALAAFFLDGFANVVESVAGRALGGRRLDLFDIAVRRTSLLAGGTALGLALIALALGEAGISLLTTLGDVQQQARHALPLASLYVFLSFAAFQLDGIFIGTSRTRAMRNASMLATTLFVLATFPLAGLFGNDGLWWAFVLYVVIRALALGAQYPALRESLRPRSHRGGSKAREAH
ncbi:MATE family efflux transporter [Myxococcota bacterium]|nr:MATE family efflux transporter [Myxococcota bacterium]